MTSRTIGIGMAAAAVLLATTAAPAADLPEPNYRAPLYEPAYATWTGGYFGLNAGYGFGTSNWDLPAVSTSPKGFVGGGTLGYNLQTGTWLWGVEGDFAISTMKGSVACAPGVSCETKNSWLATARGRIGYAGANNWMPYLTGGLAMGDIKASTATSSASKTKLGYTLGGGLEFAMLSSWSVKLEYLYIDLGKFDCGIACGAASDNVGFKTNVVRAGLNYRF